MTRRDDLEKLSIEELMRRGSASARVGDNDEAESYFREVVRREPDNADAWLWLGGVTRNPPEKRDCFERVLALRPGDEEAQAGLERLARKYGQAVLVREDEDEPLTCTWHPDRETLLRCNRCGRPMCTECAVKHPVGLRCKECVRELRSPLYVVSPAGYAGAALVALIAGTLAALVLAFLPGGFLIALLVGAGVGTGIGEAVSVASGRKRGRGLQVVALGGMILGVVAAGMILARSPAGALYLLVRPAVLVYLVMGLGAAAARLR